jgi:hypothetical protein
VSARVIAPLAAEVRRMVDGRRLLDARGVARLTGRSLTTVKWWAASQRRTGFPLPVARVDGRYWYDPAAVRAFWRRWLRHVGSVGLDRSGDPEDLVGTAEAARIVGAKSWRSLRSMVLWPELAARADVEQVGRDGRVRRLWRRETVWRVAGSAPRGRGLNRQPWPRGPVDRSGDPEELVGSTEAARVLGYSGPAALPEALKERADSEQVGPRGGRVRRRYRRRTLWDFGGVA